jgi:hypothetical protein
MTGGAADALPLPPLPRRAVGVLPAAVRGFSDAMLHVEGIAGGVHRLDNVL